MIVLAKSHAPAFWGCPPDTRPYAIAHREHCDQFDDTGISHKAGRHHRLLACHRCGSCRKPAQLSGAFFFSPFDGGDTSLSPSPCEPAAGVSQLYSAYKSWATHDDGSRSAQDWGVHPEGDPLFQQPYADQIALEQIRPAACAEGSAFSIAAWPRCMRDIHACTPDFHQLCLRAGITNIRKASMWPRISRRRIAGSADAGQPREPGIART